MEEYLSIGGGGREGEVILMTRDLIESGEK